MNEIKSVGDLLKTKRNFEILDGLRGVAAFAVVVFHYMEWVFPDFNKYFISHGFLAVDFFFCLSGFVIDCAYDKRIRLPGHAVLRHPSEAVSQQPVAVSPVHAPPEIVRYLG